MNDLIWARCLATVAVLLVAGCAGALSWNPAAVRRSPSGLTGATPLPREYGVKPGDTLYSIAWRYGLDYHDLATWNGINGDYLIKPGEMLRLDAPYNRVPPVKGRARRSTRVAAPAATRLIREAAPSARRIQWVWPARGGLVRMFHPGNPLSTGIDIAGALDQGIYAAAAGKVVYTGSGIIGYGQLIIIKDSRHFLSAYAHNDDILVREGDTVDAGQRIATMGLGRDRRPLLHFEIRYNGKPVNPLDYLPQQKN